MNGLGRFECVAADASRGKPAELVSSGELISGPAKAVLVVRAALR